MSALLKLTLRFGDNDALASIRRLLTKYAGSLNVELQQRSVEFSGLASDAMAQHRATLLAPMPILDEGVFRRRRRGSMAGDDDDDLMDEEDGMQEIQVSRRGRGEGAAVGRRGGDVCDGGCWCSPRVLMPALWRCCGCTSPTHSAARSTATGAHQPAARLAAAVASWTLTTCSVAAAAVLRRSRRQAPARAARVLAPTVVLACSATCSVLHPRLHLRPAQRPRLRRWGLGWVT